MRTTFVWWIRGKQFAELAAMSIASVKKVYPLLIERRLCVYTDDPEWQAWRDAVAPHGSGVEIHPFVTGRPAMAANVDAQCAALAGADPWDRILFLDADTIVQQQFPFDVTADLFVTWRDHVNGDREMAKQQPYNYGVLGVVANASTIEAFNWLRARILQMAQKSQDWYGNQLALEQLLGAPRKDPWDVRVRWSISDTGTPLRVQPLPCDVWNYSPSADDEVLAEKGILHFKGNRKDLMQRYAA